MIRVISSNTANIALDPHPSTWKPLIPMSYEIWNSHCGSLSRWAVVAVLILTPSCLCLVNPCLAANGRGGKTSSSIKRPRPLM